MGMLTRGQKGKTGQKSSGTLRKRATDGRIVVSFLSRFKPHRNHATYCSPASYSRYFNFGLGGTRTHNQRLKRALLYH